MNTNEIKRYGLYLDDNRDISGEYISRYPTVRWIMAKNVAEFQSRLLERSYYVIVYDQYMDNREFPDKVGMTCYQYLVEQAQKGLIEAPRVLECQNGVLNQKISLEDFSIKQEFGNEGLLS